jgi:hypothetical protein
VGKTINSRVFTTTSLLIEKAELEDYKSSGFLDPGGSRLREWR